MKITQQAVKSESGYTKILTGIDPHYLIVFAGAATAGWKQQVTATLTSSDGQDQLETIVLSSEYDTEQALSNKAVLWGPYNHQTKLTLLFQAFSYDNQSSTKVQVNEDDATISSVDDVQTIIFATEDGGDSDYDDTTLAVTFIPCTKRKNLN